MHCSQILISALVVGSLTPSAAGKPPSHAASALSLAQEAFYNADYEEAAAHAFELRAAAPDDLASYELRTTALLFQVKRLMGDDKTRNKDLKACHRCPALIADFLRDTATAQLLARDRLRADPANETALYFLGKIDLNYVWLHLGPLGRKAGWSEYWEARRSLDSVLRHNPDHVRARVARAWVDYIVGTRMPRGTKWLAGGGSRQRALSSLRKAAGADADFYSSAEARFALWEMLTREQDFNAAIGVARELMRDFPSNQELAKFVETYGAPEDVTDSEAGIDILMGGARLDPHGFWLSRPHDPRAAQSDS
jgi:tetratricopeptide (TPR) repeat protein